LGLQKSSPAGKEKKPGFAWEGGGKKSLGEIKEKALERRENAHIVGTKIQSIGLEGGTALSLGGVHQEKEILGRGLIH